MGHEFIFSPLVETWPGLGLNNVLTPKCQNPDEVFDNSLYFTCSFHRHRKCDEQVCKSYVAVVTGIKYSEYIFNEHIGNSSREDFFDQILQLLLVNSAIGEFSFESRPKLNNLKLREPCVLRFFKLYTYIKLSPAPVKFNFVLQ